MRQTVLTVAVIALCVGAVGAQMPAGQNPIADGRVDGCGGEVLRRRAGESAGARLEHRPRQLT